VKRPRATVVPTTITGPPRDRTHDTSAAVVGGTRNRSAWGGSPASGEDTPVCSTSGANSTPSVTRRVTSDGENGRAAEGISALPGSRANTVW
jgi:hypothetical protein